VEVKNDVISLDTKGLIVTNERINKIKPLFAYFCQLVKLGRLFFHKHCFEEQKKTLESCIIPIMISLSILGYVIDGQKEGKMPLMNV
jgi:hypothetical protein